MPAFGLQDKRRTRAARNGRSGRGPVVVVKHGSASAPIYLTTICVRDLVLALGLSEHGSGAPAAKRLYLGSDHPRKAEFFARLIRGHRAGHAARDHAARSPPLNRLEPGREPP